MFIQRSSLWLFVLGSTKARIHNYFQLLLSEMFLHRVRNLHCVVYYKDVKYIHCLATTILFCFVYTPVSVCKNKPPFHILHVHIIETIIQRASHLGVHRTSTASCLIIVSFTEFIIHHNLRAVREWLKGLSGGTSN